MSKTSRRLPAEVREQAVRLVRETRKDHDSEWATLCSIAPKVDCRAETLRKWVRRAERDEVLRPGPTSEEQACIQQLERENRELKRANEILLKASADFSQAELDRRPKQWCGPSTSTAASTASSRSAGCWCSAPGFLGQLRVSIQATKASGGLRSLRT